MIDRLGQAFAKFMRMISDTDTDSENALAPGKFALVAEGGGQKGIFTAGVLDVFLKQRFWPFDLHVGVSAGAQNLAAYCARARQYAHQAISQLTTRKEFFRPANILTGRNIIDLDWYFSQVVDSDDHRFPTDISELTEAVNFYAVASDPQTYESYYLKTTGDNLWQNLKASSAIPFLYRMGVEIDDVRLMDGGLTDPIPVKWAYAQGARKIVVIRTVEPGHTGELALMERLKPLIDRLGQTPKMYEMYRVYQERYAEALNFMNNPPEDCVVHEIAPNGPLKSMVLGSNPNMLKHDYLIGMRAARQFLKDHGEEYAIETQAAAGA